MRMEGADMEDFTSKIDEGDVSSEPSIPRLPRVVSFDASIDEEILPDQAETGEMNGTTEAVCSDAGPEFVSSSSGDGTRINNYKVCVKPSVPLADVLQNTICSIDAAGDVSSSSVDHLAAKGASSTMALGADMLNITKESKTSNVNVLVTENAPNNSLFFDSEKYAKCDKAKLKNTLDNLSNEGLLRDAAMKDNNLSAFHKQNLSLDEASGKKYKRSNCILEQSVSVEGIVNDLGPDGLATNKRIRLDEKNMQLELQRSQGASGSGSNVCDNSGSICQSSSSSSNIYQSGSSSSSNTCHSSNSSISGGPSSPKHQECVSNIARLASDSDAAKRE